MEYKDHVARLRVHDPKLADQLAPFTNLRHVLDWMKGRGLALNDVDVIARDEFSHDFLFRADDAGRYLSFVMS